MSFLDEVIGAIVAVEGVKKLDPNAGLLEEGAAAFVGFKGTGAVEELAEEFMHHHSQAKNSDSSDDNSYNQADDTQ